jgi:hypothetical protein
MIVVNRERGIEKAVGIRPRKEIKWKSSGSIGKSYCDHDADRHQEKIHANFEISAV